VHNIVDHQFKVHTLGIMQVLTVLQYPILHTTVLRYPILHTTVLQYPILQVLTVLQYPTIIPLIHKQALWTNLFCYKMLMEVLCQRWSSASVLEFPC